jgi:hypothetical protein
MNKLAMGCVWWAAAVGLTACGSSDSAVIGPSHVAAADVQGDGSVLTDVGAAPDAIGKFDGVAPDGTVAPDAADGSQVPDAATDVGGDAPGDVVLDAGNCSDGVACAFLQGPCTSASCVQGQCVAVALPNGVTCDDGNACTAGDECQGGACLPGPAVVCDDANPCTTDACVATGAGCSHTPVEGACSDGDACTSGDACAAGVCKPGSATSCSDGNPCTLDTCDPIAGCAHLPGSLTCTDGNACTEGDACQGGVCAPGSPLGCDDANPCTTDACDPIAGCTHGDNSLPCSDGSPCTDGDLCSGGACQPGPAKACSDGNPCTDDGCGAQGCVFLANTATCEDGNGCTIGDGCQASVCLPGPVTSCDDGNACTTDSCASVGGCQHIGNVLPCNDGNACTAGDACQSGSCQGGQAVACNDGNPCTDDACVPGSGCAFTANSVPCDDQSACTQGDICKAGQCVPGKPTACEDNNPCTTETCDPGQGCKNVVNTLACDDGNACTLGDACSGGACVPGQAAACSDGNPCTDDACLPKSGCSFTNNAAACNDGNVCTGSDACKGGVCLPGAATSCDDGNPCTTDTCDPGQGCVHAAGSSPCDDGNPCTQGDVCGGGACQGGKALACNDGNPCTDDSCDVKQGCVSMTNQAPCTDGNACTQGDACQGGTCTAGAALVCDDGNACTTDVCDAKVGCKSSANSLPCDDGSVCTVGDGCQGGACVAGQKVACNDGNPCTNDACDLAKGCTATFNTTACDDGNACTQGDACSGGKCAGSKVSCDDGNVCTSDFCDASGGCNHVGPSGWGACSSQCVDLQNDAKHCGTCTKACGAGELCQQGGCVPIVCVPGGVVACYDGAPGTSGVGACQPGTRTCNASGTGWATACLGEVTPKAAEDCSTPVDDDCNGKTNDALGCGLTLYRFNFPTDCGAYCYHDEPHNIAINGPGQGNNTAGYNKFDGGQLTDGVKGTDDWSANLGKGNAYEWVGFVSKQAQIDFQFPKPRSLALVRLGLDNFINGGVYQPPEVRVSFSDDGVTFTTPLVFKVSDGTMPAIPGGKRGDITLKFPAVTAQYIAVRFFNGSVWTFVDEVLFD